MAKAGERQSEWHEEHLAFAASLFLECGCPGLPGVLIQGLSGKSSRCCRDEASIVGFDNRLNWTVSDVPPFSHPVKESEVRTYRVPELRPTVYTAL